jgi:hypothetical protein
MIDTDYETAYRLGWREGAAKELRKLARWFMDEKRQWKGDCTAITFEAAAKEARSRARKLEAKGE